MISPSTCAGIERKDPIKPSMTVPSLGLVRSKKPVASPTSVPSTRRLTLAGSDLIMSGLPRSLSTSLLQDGVVFTSDYLDGLAEEVNQMLQESGQLRLVELAANFNITTQFLIEALNPRLGTIVQGHCESGILFTSTYIERQTACIRGAFSAITRPTPIAAVQVTPSGERPGREPGFAGPGRVLVVAEEHFPLSLVVGFPPCPLAEDLPAPILVPPLVSWLSFASGVQWPGPMDGDGGISDFFVTDGGMVEEPPSGASGRAGALGPFDGGVPPAPPPAAVAPLRPPPL